MARRPRMHQTGDVHHVMSHSIDSLTIFETNTDRDAFVTILGRYLMLHSCHCYGFVLMKNHYHLLLRPSGDDFSNMMRCINSAYAQYFNRSRTRRGYVFWDRFKSIPTRDSSYITQLILYIHANPLRAGMVDSVEDLAGYRWSSHRYLYGHRCPFKWLKVGYMNALLSMKPGDFASNYLKILGRQTQSPCDPWERDEEHAEPFPTVPANVCQEEAQWVRTIVRAAEEKRVFRARLRKLPNHLQKLVEASCAPFGISGSLPGESIRTASRQKALRLFSHWAVTHAGYTGAFIGRLLQLNGSTILRAARLGRRLAEGTAFPLAMPQVQAATTV